MVEAFADYDVLKPRASTTCFITERFDRSHSCTYIFTEIAFDVNKK